jgi:hypothetical protein
MFTHLTRYITCFLISLQNYCNYDRMDGGSALLFVVYLTTLSVAWPTMALRHKMTR